MAKSLVDLAFELVSSKGQACSFEEIWVYVCNENGVDVNDMGKKAQFYTNLSIDGRLYNVVNNQWNLASLQTVEEKKDRYKYDDALDASEPTTTYSEDDGESEHYEVSESEDEETKTTDSEEEND